MSFDFFLVSKFYVKTEGMIDITQNNRSRSALLTSVRVASTTKTPLSSMAVLSTSAHQSTSPPSGVCCQRKLDYSSDGLSATLFVLSDTTNEEILSGCKDRCVYVK